MRVTQTTSVATEKGINAEIILYNNSQNVIKVSDFRANDDIQKHIENRFSTLKPKGPLKSKVVYVRKRGQKRGGRGTGRGIKLEELAKIRYAYLVEPTLVLDSPKELWSHESDGGKYEQIFGVNGELQPIWPDEMFDETLLALAFFVRIDEATKTQAKKLDFRSFSRLKWHALSMAGEYVRAMEGFSIKENLANEKTFNETWEKFWSLAANRLIDDYVDTVEDGKVSIYAMARSEERWKKMRRKFTGRL